MKTEYCPPRRALIDHVLDDGTVARVACDVESHHSTRNDYWVSYTDPESECTLISDFAREDELQFFEVDPA